MREGITIEVNSADRARLQAIPAGKIIHVVLDRLRHAQARQEPAHAKAGVHAWLDRRPRFVFHYTPTSASRLNAVEAQTPPQTRSLSLDRRSPDRHQPFLKETNDDPRPFVWTGPSR
jgi:hypothetical protein